MNEDYVSFETAKLLKEKGFVVPYDSFRGVYINGEFLRRNPGQGYLHNMDDEIIDVCSLQMAMKWLREVYGLHCVVDYDIILGWNNKITSLKETVEDHYTEMKTYIPYKVVNHPSYKEACEEAIQYCLENLI